LYRISPLRQLEAINGAQPHSRVESNMSPSAKCSTRKPSGRAQLVEQP
jgi:hypothetical protein